MTVDELASHKHLYKLFCEDGATANDSKCGKFMAAKRTADVANAFMCGDNLSAETHIYASGGNQAHNNTPLSMAAYGWRRIS